MTGQRKESNFFMCQDNYNVSFLKLIKYREKKAKIEFKIQGEKRDSIY